MAGQALLSARGLTRDFRGFRAVDGVDLDVAAGSVHALVGPNGAGKTTLFNLLTGFLDAERRAGSSCDGRDITGHAARAGRPPRHRPVVPDHQPLPAADRARARRAGACSAAPGWAGGSGARRSCWAASATGPTNCSTRSGWPTLADAPPASLAYGRKRALELAIALALDPKVLLLDEPTAGHGPGGRRPHRRARSSAVRAGPDRGDGRAQHERRRPARRHGHRAAGRPGPRRGPVREVRADERVITAYLGAAPMLRIENLSAWYGEAQVLRDVDLRGRRRARWSPSSAATAPARPRCCAA